MAAPPQIAPVALGAPVAAPPGAKENLESVLKVEPLALEVGRGLVKMVEGGRNSPLLRRIAGIRKQMASDACFLIPPVRVTDNLQLRAGEYVILLKGVEVARHELVPNCELAIHAGGSPAGSPPPLDGVQTREPAFGIPVVWIPANQADHARAKGFTVVDPVSVLGTHLAEVIRRNAHELLSRQDTKNIRGICS